MKFEPGQRVKVLWDDENPEILNGQIVTVVEQMTQSSPYWIRVEFQGDTSFSVRGSEVQIKPKET